MEADRVLTGRRYVPKLRNDRAEAERIIRKIDARREREVYDRTHPWRPMVEARVDGFACELIFATMGGDVRVSERAFFLDEDRNWYCIDPPERMYQRVMNWRRTDPERKLTPGRREEIKAAISRMW